MLDIFKHKDNLTTAPVEAGEDERQRLLALINSLTDAVIAVNRESLITLYNGAVLDLLNTNADLKSRYIDTVMPLVTEKDTIISLAELTGPQSGITKRDDLVYVTNEGNRVNIDLTISPIRTFNPKHPQGDGYILVMRDVTRSKSLDQQRDEFISVVSHELRTPLAIAEANISTALLPKFGPFKPETAELLNQAHKNAVFLADLIKDLTTLARAEQGNLLLDIKPVKPANLIESLASDYRAQAEAKGLKLIAQPNDLSPIETSEYRLREILQNFLVNALKYTPKGSITVGVTKSPTRDSGLVFSVKDTGIGISSSDKQHIFEKFYRSEDYRTRSTGGTGLGLYIAHKLAERLNGRIWFESKLNKGATFFLEVGDLNEPQT